MQVPLSDILYDQQFNVRGYFTKQSVEELAASIKATGLIQPLTVRPWNTLPYHLVCGHRRFKAVTHLGWTHVEVVVRELNDHEARLYNLQENLARVNLSPSQELRAIVMMYGETPDAKTVAKELGRSRKWVHERLAIRKLHPLVKVDIDNGILSSYDISLLIRVPFHEQPSMALKLKLAHAEGKSTQSVMNILGKTRTVRTRAQIQKMLSDLMDLGMEPPGWKCLAWAAGTITASELYESAKGE